MRRKGSIATSVLVIVLGVFVVMGIWYLFAIGIPSSRKAPDINLAATFPKITSSTATSTATSSFPAGNFLATTTIQVAAGTLSSLFMVPFGPSATSTVLALIEGVPAPLNLTIIDPRFQSGLSVDALVKVEILSLLRWSPGLGAGAWLDLVGRELNLVVPMSYATGLNLVPGTLMAVDVAGCRLYEGWPNFVCATKFADHPSWKIASSSLFVLWQGQNGATVSLAGGMLSPSGSSSTLLLHFAVTSGYGEFCPSSLKEYGLGVPFDEAGRIVRPMQLFAAPCVGPGATTTADVFWGAVPSSTPITVQVFAPGGVQQTFFNLYPLPNRTLFVQTAPN